MTRHLLAYLLALAFLTTGLLVGCQRSPAQTAEQDLADADPGPIIDQRHAMVSGVMLTQRITARWQDGSRSFDAVLQATPEALTVVGLSPMGQPGFVIRLVGREVSFDNHSRRELPFPPEFVLADVQKVYFDWSEAGQTDLAVEEVEEDGRTVRVFSEQDGTVFAHVTYDTTLGADASNAWTRLPHRATVEHRLYGYALEIQTLAVDLLDEVEDNEAR